MNFKKLLLVTTIVAIASFKTNAQQNETNQKIESEIKDKYSMPLYLDLPAEIDVEKGYQEFNVLGGFTGYKNTNTFRTLVEYAFAPAKRLSFEVELPFSFEKNKKHNTAIEIPVEGEEVIETEEIEVAQNRLEGLKFGGMYTFAVIPKNKMAFSAGFFNEFEAAPFKEFGKPLFEGNVFQPFVGGAKVWGDKFHTLIYTGPTIKTLFHENQTTTNWNINTNLSYRFGKNENYAGIEINQTAYDGGYFETILRPQVHLSFATEWVLGIGATIAAHSEEMNGGGFFRLIFMPKIK